MQNLKHKVKMDWSWSEVELLLAINYEWLFVMWNTLSLFPYLSLFMLLNVNLNSSHHFDEDTVGGELVIHLMACG